MAYNKEHCKVLGAQLVATIEGVADGLDAQDMAAGMAFLQALRDAEDEIRAELWASLLLVLAGAEEAVADKMLGELSEVIGCPNCGNRFLITDGGALHCGVCDWVEGEEDGVTD